MAKIIDWSKYDYNRDDYYRRLHYIRFETHVKVNGLLCQECGGVGEYVDEYIDHHAIYQHCGWCEGTGLVTKWLRGQWLKYKRLEKSTNTP